MAERYILDKILKVGQSYVMEADKYMVIRAIGTDDTARVRAFVAGNLVGEFTNIVAPLHKTSSNLLGPLPLEDLYIVVPPNKTLYFDGTAGKKVRVIGYIYELGPGEQMSAEHIARYGNQSKAYWTYLDDSVSVGTDVALSAGQEVEIKTYSPASIEKYLFSKVLMVGVSGGSFSEGDLALRLYLDGKPLDLLSSEMGPHGIDVTALPRPPSDSTEETPFSLMDNPIQLDGDHRLKVVIVNTSGGSLAPTSGSSWQFTFTAPIKYIQTG